jgi:transcriptional regulator with XRE-family HTH domain
MTQTEPIDVAIGAEIRAARARRSWSRQQLADRASVSFGALRRYESGERSLTMTQLEQISAAFGVPVLDFLADALRSRSSFDHPGQDSSRHPSRGANAQGESSGLLNPERP